MSSSLVVEIAVEPKSRADRTAFKLALQRLLDGDVSLAASEDEDVGQTILRSSDESRLTAAVCHLRHDLDQRINVGAPQVAYRESLIRVVDVDYTYKKQLGGSGEFARIKITVEPGQRGQGIIFKNDVTGSNVPKAYIPSVETGIRAAAAAGSLVGFPIIDFTVTLYDGAYHDIDSSALAFEIAARGGMREAAQKAGIKLLEPIMKVVVLTPLCWRDAVVAGLTKRFAVFETESGGSLCVVVALAPMAQLFGFDDALAAVSQGEARYTMLLDHYCDVPPGIVFPDDPFPTAAALRA